MYPSQFEMTVLATVQQAQEFSDAEARRRAADQARGHDEWALATATADRPSRPVLNWRGLVVRLVGRRAPAGAQQ